MFTFMGVLATLPCIWNLTLCKTSWTLKYMSLSNLDSKFQLVALHQLFHHNRNSSSLFLQ